MQPASAICIVSTRKLLHLPEETGRGFPETNGTAFAHALVMAEEAGIAGNYAQCGETSQITVRWRKVPPGSSDTFRMETIFLLRTVRMP